MRSAIALIVALSSCAAVEIFAATTSDFAQTTIVAGKAPAGLAGAWLLYGRAEFPGNKSRALPPQLLAVSQARDGTPTFRLLDVRLPPSIYDPYQAANRAPTAWQPTADDLALLRKDWSKLPPATSKDWRKSEVVYDRVEFTIVSPE